GIACLYTSSVSVYADRETGPITPETEPDGTSDYALYKLACEERVRAADPGAVIARIGWQIGTDPGSNNMVDFLHTRAREDGAVHAGTRWYPACSFLEDTAAVLYRLRDEAAPGIYLVDGNRHLSFFEIASALNRIRGRPWQVLPADEPVLDLRMVDRRVERPAIEGRLGLHA
ncbi:MAG TPA: sugar nucleotide-binding protein, partial [Anaerolineales bacterium]|nr:sugar nucleotide-binding protein [Anaerolineales bacterium]